MAMTKAQLAAIWQRQSMSDFATLVEELDTLIAGPTIFPSPDPEPAVDLQYPSDTQAP